MTKNPTELVDYHNVKYANNVTECQLRGYESDLATLVTSGDTLYRRFL